MSIIPTQQLCRVSYISSIRHVPKRVLPYSSEIGRLFIIKTKKCKLNMGS